jgi:tRNA(Ile)-lysidine synthase
MKLLAAVSGGVDSMVLLDLLIHWREETHAVIAVGHVDHGLRGRASQKDALFVLDFCRKKSALPRGYGGYPRLGERA